MTPKIAIVTGANGSIGSNLIKELELQGVKCIKVDKEGEVDYKCDFSRVEDIYPTAVKIMTEQSHIDYLFNIAGVGIYVPINDLQVSRFVESININLVAPFIFTKCLLISMDSSSMILNIGSGMGVKPTAERIAYCTSKFGLRGFSLSLAKERENVCLLTLGSVMDNFGTGGMEKRLELEKEGKSYLSIPTVIKKIMDIVNQSTPRDEEYILYPEGY